jgi:hypothetical protein
MTAATCRAFTAAIRALPENEQLQTLQYEFLLDTLGGSAGNVAVAVEASYVVALAKICKAAGIVVDLPPVGSVRLRAFDTCGDCGECMNVCADTSELVCTGCGACETLLGCVFEDVQFWNNEGQNVFSNGAAPDRHFESWLSRILARENVEELATKGEQDHDCGELLINTLRTYAVENGVLLQTINIKWIRSALKSCGFSKYNKNASLIMKLLTGVAPPQIPTEILDKVRGLFLRVLERVRGRMYHPYYIYKLFDCVLADTDVENRRVLDRIHLQSRNAVISADREREKICTHIEGLVYRATPV